MRDYTRSVVVIAGIILVAVLGALFIRLFYGDAAIDQSPEAEITMPAKPSAPRPITAAEWVSRMNEEVQKGGFAATFGAEDTHVWKVDENHQLERFRLTDTGFGFARISSTVALTPEIVHVGAALYWPVDLSQKFNGQKVQVGIIARTAAANGSPEFGMVFATRQAGNSGWHFMKPGADFSLLTFEFQIPPVAAGYTNEPMVMIHADPKGAGRAIEVLGVMVRAVP